MRYVLILMLAGLSACIASTPTAVTSPPADTRPAPSCLEVGQIAHRIAISDRQIRFDMANGERWINTLKAECPGLRFNNAFSWDVTGGQVCANSQTIHVADRGTPCQLGGFTRAP